MSEVSTAREESEMNESKRMEYMVLVLELAQEQAPVLIVDRQLSLALVEV